METESTSFLQIREYEQVIIEDRIEKEKTRKKIEQDDLELKSIIKVTDQPGHLGSPPCPCPRPRARLCTVLLTATAAGHGGPAGR